MQGEGIVRAHAWRDSFRAMNRRFAAAVFAIASLAANFALAEPATAPSSQPTFPLDRVRPFVTFSAPTSQPAEDALAEKIRRVATKSLAYNLAWLAQEHRVYNRPNGPAYKFADPNEMQLRPGSHIAKSIALLFATHALPGDEGQQNRTLDTAVALIRGAAGEHKANASLPGDVQWGDAWQSALWCAEYTEAAWLLWDRLDDVTRREVLAMAIHEADRIAKRPVPVWAKPDGTIVTPGDTKAEENAWDSRILDVCLTLMPDHSHADAWRDRFTELTLTAYARQSDLTNPRVIRGKPISTWIHGFNVYPFGLVENHKRLHPDYASAVDLLCVSINLHSLAHTPIPAGIPFNFDVVYDALNAYAFKPGEIVAGKPALPPGGTMYQHDANGKPIAFIYAPHGNDWGNLRVDNFAENDVFASVLGIDAGKPYNARQWADVRWDKTLELQSRHDGTPLEGMIYEDKEFAPFRPREANSFQYACEAWTVLWLRANGHLSRSES